MGYFDSLSQISVSGGASSFTTSFSSSESIFDFGKKYHRGPITAYAAGVLAYLRPDILGYIYLVRVKTSITLPSELLGRLDRIDKNRSALLERAARAYLALLESEERDRRDIEIIDRNADRLNREAADSLEYQKLP